jgi:hypothetical protein
LYIESESCVPPDLTGLSGGWQVEPAEVRAFASAVYEVRQGINEIRRQADALAADPPLLGTSTIGHGLADKFLDRAGADGLLGELYGVLTQLEDFVTAAEQTAAEYQQKDNTAAWSFGAG